MQNPSALKVMTLIIASSFTTPTVASLNDSDVRLHHTRRIPDMNGELWDINHYTQAYIENGQCREKIIRLVQRADVPRKTIKTGNEPDFSTLLLQTAYLAICFSNGSLSQIEKNEALPWKTRQYYWVAHYKETYPERYEE